MENSLKVILNEKGEISGFCAFLYHTSFGTPPVELERLSGRKIDMEEYNKLFLEHRKVSAKSSLKKFGHQSKLLKK